MSSKGHNGNRQHAKKGIGGNIMIKITNCNTNEVTKMHMTKGNADNLGRIYNYLDNNNIKLFDIKTNNKCLANIIYDLFNQCRFDFNIMIVNKFVSLVYSYFNNTYAIDFK